MDAHELRAFRRARGLTQMQLAGVLDISQSMVSQMETGRRPIPKRERKLAGEAEPSLGEDLEQLIEAEQDELHQWAEDVGVSAPTRGPYS